MDTEGRNRHKKYQNRKEEGTRVATEQVLIRERTATASMPILQNILGNYHPRDFAVRLWDGTTWDAEPG